MRVVRGLGVLLRRAKTIMSALGRMFVLAGFVLVPTLLFIRRVLRMLIRVLMIGVMALGRVLIPTSSRVLFVRAFWAIVVLAFVILMALLPIVVLRRIVVLVLRVLARGIGVILLRVRVLVARLICLLIVILMRLGRLRALATIATLAIAGRKITLTGASGVALLIALPILPLVSTLLRLAALTILQ